MPLKITKTPKCYVGGAFIRSESGRVFELKDASGAFFANLPRCTKKDLRNAVEAAAKAGAGWAKRTPYNRAQILYRLAEMLEARSAEMAEALTLGGTTKAGAAKEVAATIERIVHFAGWADKYEQVLGSVNPVASAHFNFTVTEAVGVVGVLAPEEAPLLGLMTLILPVITGGNSVVALVSRKSPYPSILLGEMLATSDLPGGVVNLMTGDRKEMLATFASHEQIRALSAVAESEEATALQRGAADSVKRVKLHAVKTDWFSEKHDSPYAIRDFTEAKTVWHPIGS
ncbi:aldehyde dehydrogenase family protein [Luteolibacter sp. GHJ8]|uniref:Aldehyde dehydrogenase family protein n=1 Tax=Luteolibacter rhizosphaerae TaxID=2989719 RepID=A0ABT3G405_9BACT|nr:aldehyde dehydrogenase family protein [Luteolibacter rhizosphaerae]MCW1914571.1 aldehyde dehydrogenase family protein [Luteolibacter rhizosphaerae]